MPFVVRFDVIVSIVDVVSPSPTQRKLRSRDSAQARGEDCGELSMYRRRLRMVEISHLPDLYRHHVHRCLLSSEFNYRRDLDGSCVLVNGTQPLPSDDSCRGDDEFWYERTAYRKVPFSSCVDGVRPDHGPQHYCPGIRGHGFFFWLFVVVIPVGLAALIGYWWFMRSGMARGYALFQIIDPYSHLIRIPSTEPFDYLEETAVTTTARLVQWILWPPYLGSCSASQALHGNGWPLASTTSPRDTVPGGDIGTCPWTKTRRSCGSKTRSSRKQTRFWYITVSITLNHSRIKIIQRFSGIVVCLISNTAMCVCLRRLLCYLLHFIDIISTLQWTISIVSLLFD